MTKSDFVKMVYYVRHPDKDHSNGKKQRTGKGGFSLGAKLGQWFRSANVVITDIFAGELPRTWEGIVAFLASLLPEKPFTVHEYLSIGNSNVFSGFFTKEVMDEVQNSGKTNWQALNAVHDIDTIKVFAKYALDGLKDAFGAMQGDTAVISGHSPVIEGAAWFASDMKMKIDRQPESCEGMIFGQKASGDIEFVDWITLPSKKEVKKDTEKIPDMDTYLKTQSSKK